MKRKNLFLSLISSVLVAVAIVTVTICSVIKPKTNDMREAPSITIINELLNKGAIIKAFDPKAMDTARLYFNDKIQYCENSYDALEGVEGLLLLTEWNEFSRPDFDKIKALMKNPVIFDGRNQYDKKALEVKGFKYFGFGK